MAKHADAIEYIQKSLRDGHSADSVKEALISTGWQIKDVEDSIAHVLQADNINAHETGSGKMGVLSKFANVLRRPSSFFERVKNESGFKGAFVYYVILLIFVCIPQIVVSFFMLQSAQSQMVAENPIEAGIIQMLPTMLIFIFMGTFITEIIFVFVRTEVIYYIFARPLGGKGKSYETFKAYVYGFQTPMLIESLLLSVVIIFIITSTAQGITGTGMGNTIDMTGKAFQLMFVPWSVYLFARGIEKLHDVPMKRALVIALIPTILSIALMFLLPQIFGSARLA